MAKKTTKKKKKTVRKPVRKPVRKAVRKPVRKASSRKVAKKTVARRKPTKKVAKKSPVKKASSKKTSAPEVSLKISKPVSTAGVKFKTPDARGTQYQPLLDKMQKMKKGETLPVDVPKGITARVLHNRLNSVFRRFEPKAPKGCQFSKHTLADGRIGITCEAK